MGVRKKGARQGLPWCGLEASGGRAMMGRPQKRTIAQSSGGREFGLVSKSRYAFSRPDISSFLKHTHIHTHPRTHTHGDGWKH